MLNPVREGQEDYIEPIRYRRRLKIFENFLLELLLLEVKLKFTLINLTVSSDRGKTLLFPHDES